MWRVRGHGDTTPPDRGHTEASCGIWTALDHPVARLRLDDSNGVALALDAHGRTLYTAEPLVRHDLASGRTVQLPEPWDDHVAVGDRRDEPRRAGPRRSPAPGVSPCSTHARARFVGRWRWSRTTTGLLLELLRRRPPSGRGHLRRREALVWEVASGGCWRGCPSTTRVSSPPSVRPGPPSTPPARTARCASGTSTVTVASSRRRRMRRRSSATSAMSARRPEDGSSPIRRATTSSSSTSTTGKLAATVHARTRATAGSPTRIGTRTASTSRPPPTADPRVGRAYR